MAVKKKSTCSACYETLEAKVAAYLDLLISPWSLRCSLGLQEFKINVLIIGRPYLDVVDKNQIQLTLWSEKE